MVYYEDSGSLYETKLKVYGWSCDEKRGMPPTSLCLNVFGEGSIDLPVDRSTKVFLLVHIFYSVVY
jgi:hypothetical protein